MTTHFPPIRPPMQLRIDAFPPLDRQPSVFAKLSRATDTFNQLSVEIHSFIGEHDPLIEQLDTYTLDGKSFVLHARGSVSIPPRFAVLEHP